MRRVKRGEAEQTIVDLTDNRKLIVMVSTSKARQIIYNPNNRTYSPDFSKEPMVLTPELYITGSSTNVIATAETVKWYVRPNTLGQRIPIVNNDTYSIGNDFKLTISKNIMKDMLTMEFILEVIYKEPDSDFRTTIPHHMELINISMGENGRNGVDGLDGLDGEKGLPGPKGKDGESSYTHLAYANDETGAQDFSLSDSNRSYIGMYVDNIEKDSDNPSDYKWTKVEGMPGDKGIQGPKGKDGQTPWFHIAYATNATGTEGFSVSDSIGKTYIGQYTDYIEKDSDNPSDYSWTLIKGEQGPRGLQGLQGDTGLQGPKGLDSFTHIAYSTSPTGATGFSTKDSTNKTYIGMYVDNTKGDSDNPKDYKWTLIKGEKGLEGSQGIPGKAGADGRTPYFHIGYANGSGNFLNRTGEIKGFGLVSSSGSLVDDEPGYINPATSTANKIEVIPGSVMIFKKELGHGDDYWRNSWFDADGKYIDRFTPSSDLDFETVPPGAKWLRPSYPTDSNPSIHRITAVDTGNSNRKYIGHYTDYIEDDSSSPSAYSWTKIMGDDSATLAIITPDGTTSRDTTNSLRLDSKLFVGGKEVTASSYRWYYSNGSSTTTHSTGRSTSIGATVIKNSLPVFLDATYDGTTYTSSVTLNDISDVYTSIILGVATFKNGKGSNTYTVKLYRNGEEIDPGGSIYSYEWEKLNSRGVKDTRFTKKGKTITISASEIDNTNLFNCYIYTK